MFTIARRYLSIPSFENEETTRVATALNLVLLSVLVAAAPFSAFMVIVPNEINRVLWSSTFATVLVSGITLLMLRRGHVQTASRLAMAGFWLILTVELIPLGGLRSPVYSAYFIIILMTGLLIGGRAAIIVSLSSIVASFGILLLETRGLLPLVEYSGSAEWLVKAAFFFIISMLVYLAITVTEKARTRSRQIEQVLTERNKQLEREITERIAVEQKLRQQATLLENISDAVVSVDFNYTICTWNKAAEAIYGWKAEEVLGQRSDFLKTEYLSGTREDTLQTLMRDGFWRGETSQLCKDGTRIWIMSSASVMRDAEGKPTSLLSVNREVTERKAAEERLRLSEERYRIISELSSDYAYAFRVDSNIEATLEWVTEAYTRVTGYSLDTMTKLSQWDSTIHPDDRSIMREGRRRIIAKQPSQPMQFRVITQSGETRWLNNHFKAIWDEAGERIIRVYGTAQDITERKQADDKLRESESRLRAMLEGLPIGCILSDTDFRFTYWNPAAEQIFGYTFEEAQGKQAYNLITAPEFQESVADFDQRVLQSHETIRSIGENITRDERRIICEWTCTSLRDAEGKATGIIAMCQDITQRKQLEDVLQHTLDELEQRVEERTAELTAAQERLGFLLSVTPVVIYSYKASPDYRATFVSNRVRDLLGYEAEDFLNNNRFWIERLHPDDAERIAEETSLTYRIGRGTLEYRFRCADGEYRWLHDENRVVTDADGNPLEVIGYWTDITEQKQAEEALVAAEERLRFLLSVAPVVVYSYAAGGDQPITFLSSRVFDLLGYQPHEFLSDSQFWRKRVHPDDIQAIEPKLTHVLEDTSNLLEYRFHCANGEYRWLHDVSHLVRDADGNAIEVIGCWIDISARKQAEIALRESEDRFRAMSEAMPIGIIVTSLKTGKILFLNETYTGLYGLTTKEFVERDPADFWFDYSMRQKIIEQIQQQGYVHNHELPLKKGDGTPFWALYSSKVITFGGEQSILTGMYDITRRKQAEIALQESEERFRAMSEALPIGIVVTRMATGESLFLNDTHAALFGLTREQYLQRDPSENWVDFSMREGIVEQVQRQGYVHNYELPLKKGDDTPFWALYSSKVITYGGEPAILTGVYDITPRKAAEAKIEHLNHELEQRANELEFANRELEAFTYSVSHDLRAPLRAVDGFARILQDDFAAHLPGEAQRFINLVRSNAQQMGELISDLLNLSRLGRQPLTKQTVPLQQLVRDVYEGLSPERENRQVELVVGDLPECQADPSLLKQVLINLLSNALKFTRQCEVARIEVGHQVVEREVLYYIKDNGVGFDMQYANKLFGLFQRLHRMEDFEGTGIGLAIIQRIIRRHGGRVWAEAEVDKGAAFFFTLGE